MARANRYLMQGYVWHLTHRCHKGEFLLKFSRDRKRWLYWLFQAKKRYGLCVLDYIVTSNHTHLLSFGTGHDAIPKSIQLVAGRTAREYNLRKNRRGAFWQDRYHATAVESDQHLIKCLTYIVLNMVRAGVVSHPSDWSFAGYNEIQKPPERYRLVDRKKLKELLGIENDVKFRQAHRKWVEYELKNGKSTRERLWTESVATGSRGVIEAAKERFKSKAIGRKIIEKGEPFTLRETQSAYNAIFMAENDNLRAENSHRWKICPNI